MMIAIKNRFSGATLCEFDVENVKQAAEKGRDDLRGADLIGADLRGADLRGTVIDGEKVSQNPIHITCGLRYVALITDNHMRLGCKRFTHAEWAEFDDDQILNMDSGALEFWKQWKAPLLAMCAAHADKNKGVE